MTVVRRVVLGLVVLCYALLSGGVYADNETQSDLIELVRARLAQVMQGSYMVSGCLPTKPASGVTMAPFLCGGVIYTGGRSIPVAQDTASLGPLNSGDGIYWLGLHADRTSTVSGWNRQLGTHYLWQKSATQPATFAGALLAKVTIASSNITLVEDWRVPASYVRAGFYDVTDLLYGGVADDASDIGPPLQKAIDAASAQNGRIVRIPQGIYKLNTAVAINYGIEVQGDGWGPSVLKHGGGSWIHISSPAFVPFTINASGAAITNLAFDHDQPTPATGWAPTDYPSTILITNGLALPVSDVTLENLFFYKATRGISYVSSNNLSGGRFTIRNISGQFFQNGIYLDYILDVCHITDIHMWPFWSQDPAVFLWQTNHLQSMTLLRCDGCYVTNLFSFNSHIGIYMQNHTYGSVNGFQGHNLLFDGAVIGILNDQQQGGSGFIVNFGTNAGAIGGLPAPGFEHSTGLFFSGVGLYFTFVNIDTNLLGDNCVTTINGPNVITLTNLRCINYNLSSNNLAAVRALGSSNIAIHGYQNIASLNPTTIYEGAFTGAQNPGGVFFDKSNNFWAAMAGANPTLNFGVNDFLRFDPSTDKFTLWSSTGTYNTGGVKRYLCIQDGVLTVGTACP